MKSRIGYEIQGWGPRVVFCPDNDFQPGLGGRVGLAPPCVTNPISEAINRVDFRSRFREKICSIDPADTPFRALDGNLPRPKTIRKILDFDTDFGDCRSGPAGAKRSKPRGLVSPAKALERDFFKPKFAARPRTPCENRLGVLENLVFWCWNLVISLPESGLGARASLLGLRAWIA